MNGPVLALLRNDFRLQWRHGIIPAYTIVAGCYVLGFALSANAMPAWLAGLLIFSDPAVLGFFFLGGLMMLENGEGVRTALAITPATASQYLCAKAVSLTALALFAVIAMGIAKSGPIDWTLLMVSVTFTSVFFIAIGTVVALRFRTVNGYLIGSAGLLLPLTLPAIAAFLDPMPALLGLVPTIAQQRLILLALGYSHASTIEIAMMIGILIMSTLAVWLWASHSLGRALGSK